MKQCYRCGRELPEEEFNKDRSRTDGLQAACRECRREYQREYLRERYMKSRDKYLQQHAQYRVECREQRRAYQARYDEEHREEKRERDKQWQIDNPEACRAKSHRRRARLAGLPARFTNDDWQQILKSYGGRCAYCGIASDRLQQEHIIPLTQGGGYTPDNIVPACPECNQRKGNRTPEEAGMELWSSQR